MAAMLPCVANSAAAASAHLAALAPFANARPFFYLQFSFFYDFSVHCKVFCGFLRRLKYASPCHFLRGINMKIYVCIMCKRKLILRWLGGINVKALRSLKEIIFSNFRFNFLPS